MGGPDPRAETLNWSDLGVSELPTGTVTLLLADVEGSTRLLLLCGRPAEAASRASVYLRGSGNRDLDRPRHRPQRSASQCTYTSGLVDRSFSLPPNGTFDVVIAPAVPAFRSWDVNVSCDNGAVANTSKFF